MKANSPLLGFNNNVRHKGRVFHIQTEDSGVRHPHVITHLFADGGRILKTTKTSYAEHVGEASLQETVRAMMQDQHKAMFIALRDGQFDHLFEDDAKAKKSATSAGDGAAVPAPVAAPPALASAVTPEVVAAPPPVESTPVDAPQAAAPAPAPEPHAAPPPAARPDPIAARQAVITPPRVSGDGADPLRRQTSAFEAARAKTERPPAPPPLADSIDLDLDALERAAAEAHAPFFQKVNDLPPPPAAVLGKKPAAGPTVGSYSVKPAQPQGRAPMPSSPGPSAGRYAPSRPAAIFATTRPTEGSIFGEDLISEKSLDEVILSYLAEDLEGPDHKK